MRAMRPHFHFSGGEPTIYPHFERLIDAVRAKALGSVSIVSNSARPTSWWKRVAPLLNDITFSAHLEYLDIDRFAETIAVAMAKTRVHVNIPAPPELFGEAQAVFDTLTALFPGLSVSMKPILIDFRTELASYNEHQLEKLRTARTNARLSPNSDSVPRPLYLARGGEKFQMGSAAALVASGENHFEGWECQAGVEALAVTLGGDIFRAVCKIGGTIGRLGGKLPEYPIDPVVCDRAVCKCLTDIPIRKRAILR